MGYTTGISISTAKEGCVSPALQQAIQQYTAQGFYVVHQTDTTAQLRKPKQFNFAAFILLGILLFIIGAVLYAAWYTTQQDQLIYLTVDDDGTIHITGSGLSASTVPTNSWEAWAVGKSPEDMAKQLERARRQRSAPEYINWLEAKIASSEEVATH